MYTPALTCLQFGLVTARLSYVAPFHLPALVELTLTLTLVYSVKLKPSANESLTLNLTP